MARRGPGKKPERDAGSVQSLDRALYLLELLAEDDEGYRLSDLAERAGLPASTTHRLLTTLEQRRFVQFDREQNLWHVGVQCFAVGATFLRRRNVVAQALPFMRRLRDEAGETVNLGVADEGEVVFLNQVESREVMRAITRPGGRAPMHCSGLGKALLAAMPDSAVAEVLRTRGLARLTSRSIGRPAQLKAALETVRRTGYAVDDEEHAVGLRCVAAAVYDEHGTALGAISCSGPAARIPDRRVLDLGRLVRSTADEITAAIGGRPPAAR
jgi:IclR family acetate operon transcriptional repressor